MKIVTDKLFEYSVSIRRQLHQYPETGFDLPRTVGLVMEELEKTGIPFTTKYGKSSIVGYLGNDPQKKTLALRADLDALPIQEKTGLPYRSKVEGKMHACGHDAHTAVLLAVGKLLKEVEKELPCNVRLIFQPSEECAESGAKMMVENGVMEGVDAIVAAHVENALDVGTIGVCSGDYMAACIPAKAVFHGKTAHATIPETGADAVAMAVDAYSRLKSMVMELSGSHIPVIWSVGSFHGGNAHNVIADKCEMEISFRYYDSEFAMDVMKKAGQICTDSARTFGGSAELQWDVSTSAVHNDAAIAEHFMNIVGEDATVKIAALESRMSSEDFGWYLTKAPGLLFRFGTGNQATGCTTLAHCNDFRIDEEGMKYAISAFVRYVMNPCF